MKLTGSKERYSRQDFFCKMVAMKEKSGGHFPFPLQFRASRRGFACALISCMTAVNNGFDVFCGKIKGRKDSDMHGIITTNCKLLLQRYIIKRILTVYSKIFGTHSYGGDALASSCILHHMDLCRIFYDIQSITYKYWSVPS